MLCGMAQVGVWVWVCDWLGSCCSCKIRRARCESVVFPDLLQEHDILPDVVRVLWEGYEQLLDEGKQLPRNAQQHSDKARSGHQELGQEQF